MPPCQDAQALLRFFFNDTATTEIYTLSLHDALPILAKPEEIDLGDFLPRTSYDVEALRSEEHTSELQSHVNLVCRLLLGKKKEAGSAASACAQKGRRPARLCRGR